MGRYWNRGWNGEKGVEQKSRAKDGREGKEK